MIALGLLSSHLTGCATWKITSSSDDLWQAGNYEEALQTLEAGSQAYPADAEIKLRFVKLKNSLFDKWTEQISRYIEKQQWKEAKILVERALKWDSTNNRFLDIQNRLQREQKAADYQSTALKLSETNPQEALNLTITALKEIPESLPLRQIKNILEERLRNDDEKTLRLQQQNTRVNVEFKDAPIRAVLEAISRNTGVRFHIDRDVKSDLRVSLNAKNQPIDETMEWLMRSGSIIAKPIDATTWSVYPNTDEKRRQHEELILKTYTLSHAEVKTIAPSIKTMLGIKDMLVDERLNRIIFREPIETIRLIDTMIQQLDEPEAEVVLDVDIIEVNRSRLLQLGIELPNQLSLSPILPASGTMTLSDLAHTNIKQWSAGIGGITLNARRDMGDLNTLASPKLRVKNHGKASILIGDKIPTVTSTFSGGGNGFVTENITYTDVGIKFGIDGIQIGNDQHVQLKLNMEVSSIAQQIPTKNGSIAYQLGTRKAETELVIKDGETQILAGLISNTERSSASRIPILGDLPVAGRLFGSTTDNNQKTEIMLSITPHIVRSLPLQDISENEIMSGTQNQLRFRRPLRQASPGTSNAPANANPSITSPAGTYKPEDDAKKTGATSQRAPSNIELYWQTPPKSLKVGEVQTLQLKLKTDGGIRGMPIQLSLDPKQWAIERAEAGDFFSQDNGSTLFSYQNLADGRVMTSSQRSQSDAVMGDNSVISLQLRPLQKGALTIKVISASAMGLDRVPEAKLPQPLTINAE